MRRRRLFLTLLAAAGTLLLAWAKTDEPALVIACKGGGVHHVESHLATGMDCVLHDKSGGSAGAAVVTVYDDSNAPF